MLEQIWQTSRTIIEPLKALGSQLEHCNGRQFAQALYSFLLQTGAKDALTQSAQEVQSAEEERRFRLNQGAWDILMELLDVFHHVLGEVSLPLEQLRELFQMAVLSSDIGAIPTTLDQVSLGSADRMRPNHPKLTFVIGVNQGEFPPQLSENGLFSETERDRLLQSGIQLNPSVLKLSDYEKYYAYSALTSPERTAHRHLSHRQADRRGDPGFGADWLAGKDVPGLRLLGGRAVLELFYVANDQTAFEVLCRSIRQDTPTTASLMEYVRSSSYAGRLEQVLAMVQSGGFCIHSREISRMLFGSRMRLTPSSGRALLHLSLAYFCSGGLNLQPRRKVEISPMQSGTIIHFVLERMVSTHPGKGLGELSWSRCSRRSRRFCGNIWRSVSAAPRR